MTILSELLTGMVEQVELNGTHAVLIRDVKTGKHMRMSAVSKSDADYTAQFLRDVVTGVAESYAGSCVSASRLVSGGGSTEAPASEVSVAVTPDDPATPTNDLNPGKVEDVAGFGNTSSGVASGNQELPEASEEGTESEESSSEPQLG